MSSILNWFRNVGKKIFRRKRNKEFKLSRRLQRIFTKSLVSGMGRSGSFAGNISVDCLPLYNYLTKLAIKELGFREIDDRGTFYKDLEKYLGISREEFECIPKAKDRMREEAYFVLEELFADRSNGLVSLYSRHYENINDYESQSINPEGITTILLDDVGVPDELMLFATYKDSPIVINIEHENIAGTDLWDVKIYGELSSELLLLWYEKTEEYFVKTHKGKVLNAQMDPLNLAAYRLSDLVYPQNLFSKISRLRLNLDEWYKNDGILKWGALLWASPGVGKTTAANFLATERPGGCTVIYAHPADTKTDTVSDTYDNIRDILTNALLLSPTLLIFDDAEEFALSRGGMSVSSTGVMLEYLDDSKYTGKLFVLLTTNRPDIMDPAVKRAGRSHNIIHLAGYNMCVPELLMLYAEKYGLILPQNVDTIVSEWDIPKKITPDEVHNVIKRLVLTTRAHNHINKKELAQAYSETLDSFYNDSPKEECF